jgi:hypothetical protein
VYIWAGNGCGCPGDNGSMAERSPRRRLALLVVLFVLSLVPLLFLDLNEASQLAGALALPVSVMLAALPALPPARRTSRPLPWRRYSLIGAGVAALLGLGAVGYAVWDNFRDIEVSFPSDGKPDDPPWRDGSQTVLELPGTPPPRDNVTITVSLTNVHETGNCERTAELEFVPILDGRERQSVRGMPGEAVSVPLDGVQRDASVRLVLDYASGNENCAVRLHLDRAVLNG